MKKPEKMLENLKKDLIFIRVSVYNSFIKFECN